MLRKNPAYEITPATDGRRPIATARQALFTEQLNTLVLRPPPARVGCGEILFHHNSAVIMPDGFPADDWPERNYKTDAEPDLKHIEEYLPHQWRLLNHLGHGPQDAREQPRRGALGALVAALAFLKTNPSHHMLAAGHTDTSGAESDNHTLSALRAEGVVSLLENDRERWAAIATQRSVVEDYQRILDYVASTRVPVRRTTSRLSAGNLVSQWDDETSQRP